MTVLPYKEDNSSKKDQVAKMFDNISGQYDLLNRVLSFGIDIIWRKKAIAMLKKEKPALILDVATGTADFAIEALSLQPEKIIGVDISEGMLAIGRKKLDKKGLSHKIELKLADSETLPFADNTFDAVIVSFGVRNFENLRNGLLDILRVLKPGGSILILEFSKPVAFPVKQVYGFYSRYILPSIGRLISKDKSAYTYLPESVAAFPEGAHFIKILQETGYKETLCRPLTFGISSIYKGSK